MSPDEIDSCIAKFNVVAAEAQRFCYLVRDVSFQKEASQRLRDELECLHGLKEVAQRDAEGDLANFLLAMEFVAGAVGSELEMWISLKAGEPDDAWDHLVRAQSRISCAISTHSSAEGHSVYLKRLELIEQLIFPPQIFMSAGMIVDEDECSICGTKYGDCQHIKGRAYNGEFCSRIIKKADLREVSVVESPANKRCRALRWGEGGVSRNIMTWLPIPEAEGNDPDD